MLSLLDRLKQGIQKTRAGLVNKVEDVLLGKKEIDADLLDELEYTLITADVGGTARCATRRGSAWSGGLHLVNRCRQGAGDVSYAAYVFTVPKAYRFLRLRLSAYGYAGRTSELSAYYERTDGGLEIPGAVRVPRTRAQWYPVSTVPAPVCFLHRP